MPDITGAVLLSGNRDQCPGLSTVQMREFHHEQWRLAALCNYAGFLIRLSSRKPEDGGLMDRIERALTEATRAQRHLDEMTDALIDPEPSPKET